MWNPDKSLDALSGRLGPRLSKGANDWLEVARTEVAGEAGALERHFAAAGRKTGHEPLLAPAPHDVVTLCSAGGPVLNPWRVDEAARVILLLEDARREPTNAVRRATDLYFIGDGRERIAVLRGLVLLRDGDEALPAVRDALRANAGDLFAAAICENGYTSRHLPDDLFFQAVLKCAFVGLSLGRIARLEERVSPELARMLFAYVTEREHAGRSVGADVWPVIARFPPAGAIERIRSGLDA